MSYNNAKTNVTNKKDTSHSFSGESLRFAQKNKFDVDSFSGYLLFKESLLDTKYKISAISERHLGTTIVQGPYSQTTERIIDFKKVGDYTLEELANKMRECDNVATNIVVPEEPEKPEYEVEKTHDDSKYSCFKSLAFGTMEKSNKQIVSPLILFLELIPIAIILLGKLLENSNPGLFQQVIKVGIVIAIVLLIVLLTIIFVSLASRNALWNEYQNDLQKRENSKKSFDAKIAKYEESVSLRDSLLLKKRDSEKIRDDCEKYLSFIIDAINQLIADCNNLNIKHPFYDYNKKTIRLIASDLFSFAEEIEDKKMLSAFIPKSIVTNCSSWNSKDLDAFMNEFLPVAFAAERSNSEKGYIYFPKSAQLDFYYKQAIVAFFDDYYEETECDISDYLGDIKSYIVLFDKLSQMVFETKMQEERISDIEQTCRKCYKYPCSLWNDKDNYETKELCPHFDR